MLRSLYKKLWVPIMGRFLTVFIPLFEGKESIESPTYDIDGDKKLEKNK